VMIAAILLLVAAGAIAFAAKKSSIS
jgi:hypothetical protein